MKNILSIAPIAALVVSSVFATSFTGSAEVKSSFNFDDKTYGIGNVSGTELKQSWAIDSGDGSSTGAEKFYAEIAGTWSASFNPKGDKVTGNVTPAISLSVDKANIVYDKLSVSILGSGAFNGNVKNFKYKVNGADGANTEKDLVGELKMTDKAGLSFTYDSKFTAGFGIKGDVDAVKNETFVRFDVAEMAISESVKVKGAAALALKAVDGKVDLRGTIKGSYTADPVTVVVASDLQYTEDKFNAEVYGKLGYSPVSVEAYFSTANILSAKASAKFSHVTVSAFGYDLTDENLIAFGDKVEYKQDPFEASVEATYQPKTSSLTSALAGKYTAEKFVVEGGFGTLFAFKAEDKLAVSQLMRRFLLTQLSIMLHLHLLGIAATCQLRSLELSQLLLKVHSNSIVSIDKTTALFVVFFFDSPVIHQEYFTYRNIC